MLRENLFSSQYRIVYIVCQEKNNTIYSFKYYIPIGRLIEIDL